MKEINKRQIKALVDKGIIQNTARGYVNKTGYSVGFYRTKTKTYIEDKYVDMAIKLE